MYPTTFQLSLIVLNLVATAMFPLLCRGGSAQEKDSTATQFVKISELHLIYAMGTVKGFSVKASENGTPKKEINCVTAKITPELLLPPLAEAFATHFSDEELRQAISFFETEIGQAYNRNELMRVKAMFGLSTEQPRAYSASEEERIIAFEESKVGKAMVGPNSAVRAEARAKIGSRLMMVFAQCKSAKGRDKN